MLSAKGISDHSSQTILYAVLIVVLGIVVLRSAWVCDDAYISFRVVDNLVNGHGLTWNVAERVQVFTNPLWVFLVTIFYSVSGEAYYTSIFLSLFLTLAAALILVRKISVSPAAAALSIVLLVCSKAFIDFSTSGMENSLTHLLLVGFAVGYFRGEQTSRRLFWLALVASLGMLNRLDTALLYLPVLAAAYFKTPRGNRLRQVFLGFIPIIGWEIFSLIYFGFPFPNTYYAKLGAKMPAWDMGRQGLLYIVDTIDHDPLTLIVILGAVAVVVLIRNKEQAPLVLGIVLYLLYTVRIGGDFMTGRFFAAPFALAVILVARQPLPSAGPGLWGPFVIALTFGLFSPRSPLLVNGSYGTGDESHVSIRHIADERGFYYQGTGLLNDSRLRSMPDHWWRTKGKMLKDSGQKLANDVTIGFRGYAAGPTVHIIDELALADPLLARLPASDMIGWRPGHVKRTIPLGYFRSCREGINEVKDPNLSQYYERLWTITRGPVWSMRRFRDIVWINLGAYNYLIDAYSPQFGDLEPYANVSTPKRRGTSWNKPGNQILSTQGLMVELDNAVTCPAIELSVDHNDSYELSYWLGSDSVGRADIKVRIISELGLRVDTVNVKTNQKWVQFDAVRVRPVSGDGSYSLGHLRLLFDSTQAR